jgi:NAD(P)-dependent dehydrogenase (short-subunit alcohol dehydrogenase family)
MFDSGTTAVISGGASGIGRAAGLAFAAKGMNVVLIDVGEGLDAAVEEVRAAGAPEAMGAAIDVTDRAALDALDAKVTEALGGADLLFCNAGIGRSSDVFDSQDSFEAMFQVNLWGVIRMCQAFVPGMIERGSGMVVNTGSKQGITTPPGNPGYNMTKAALKVYTEQLAHHFRQVESPVTAHLMVPGFVYTGMIAAFMPEKPPGAWTSEETNDYMIGRLEKGDFYILCPDNDVDEETDRQRIAWAAGDVIENRPALSRWHPDFTQAFEAFSKKP